MFDVIYGVVHICSMLCDVLKAYSMDARPTKFPLFLSVGTEAWLEWQKGAGSENKKKRGVAPCPLKIPSLVSIRSIVSIREVKVPRPPVLPSSRQT